MHRPLRLIPIALLAMLMVMPHGAALHCNGDITTITTPIAVFYVDDRSTADGEINHWVYLESNGIAGLQSGTEHVCVPNSPCELLQDTCNHHDPDTKLS